MKLKALLLIGLLAFLPACTQQERAKAWGGTATIELPPSTKLVTATWRYTQLWYLVRPAKPGEQPETLTFEENSSFGMIKGKVIFKEQ
jgi:hypothetical protein